MCEIARNECLFRPFVNILLVVSALGSLKVMFGINVKNICIVGLEINNSS